MPNFAKIIYTATLLLTAAPLLSAEAPAKQGPGGPMGVLVTFFPLIAFAGIFYFLLFRPQQKANQQRKKMLENLKKGDRVLTVGGLYGSILGLRGETIDLKLSDNVKVEVSRNYIARLHDPSKPTANGAPTTQPSSR